MPKFNIKDKAWFMDNGEPRQTVITAVYDLGPLIFYGTEDYNGMYNQGMYEHNLFKTKEALLADYNARRLDDLL